MKRALLAGLALCSCLDFEGLLEQCRDGGGTCALDASASGGGTATGGGTGGGGGSAGGAGGGTAGGASSDQICHGGFCWENPRPQGNDLLTVYGTGPDDVWAGGWGNALLHWDGVRWSSQQSQLLDATADNTPVQRIVQLVPTPQSDALLAATFSGPFYERRDGGSWQRLLSLSGSDGVLSAAGTDLEHLWFGQLGGQVKMRRGPFAWSGSTLASSSDQGTLAAVSPDAGSIWLSYFNPNNPTGAHLFRCATDRCITADEVATFDPLVSLTAREDDSLVAIDDTGLGLRVFPDGGSRAFTGTAGGGAASASVQRDGGVVLGGNQSALFVLLPDGGWQRQGGVRLPPVNAAVSWHAVWTSPRDLGNGSWAVGHAGAMARYDQPNDVWVSHTTGSLYDVTALLALGGSDDVIAGDSLGNLLVRDGGAWELADFLGGGVNDISPARDGGAWIVGRGGYLVRWSRERGAVSVYTAPGNLELYTVLELESGALLLTTHQGGIFRYENGGVTVEVDAGRELFSLDGWDDTHVWAVGAVGTVRTRNGNGTWTNSSISGNTLSSVFATRDAGVFITSVHNDVWRLAPDGGFKADPLPTNAAGNDRRSVFGTSGDDVWLAGLNGSLRHFDGASWSTTFETGTRADLFVLSARVNPDGGRELFMAGERGAILRHAY